MKKLHVLCVIAYLLAMVVVVSTTAKAESWKVSTFNNPQGLWAIAYSLEIPSENVSCRINIFENGTIETFGYDSNYYGKGASSALTLTVTKDGLQNTYQSQTISQEMHMSDGNIISFLDEGGYNVFDSKCSPHSGTLPKEVRKMFQGRFDIK